MANPGNTLASSPVVHLANVYVLRAVAEFLLARAAKLTEELHNQTVPAENRATAVAMLRLTLFLLRETYSRLAIQCSQLVRLF